MMTAVGECAGYTRFAMHMFSRRALLSAVPTAPMVAHFAGAEKSEVGAVEDLMREHGVIRRTLLVYRECVRRLQAGSVPPAGVVIQAGELIRRFAETYHERLEEEEVFPRLEKAGKERALVSVLREQHAAGRVLTSRILEVARSGPSADAGRASLADNLLTFVRMYEAHAAREDTVLFPAFHALFDERTYDALGERFETREHQILGKQGGFEAALVTVADLETAVGIADLARLTPRTG
jgi:hemerythrin-like domain-containing protein